MLTTELARMQKELAEHSAELAVARSEHSAELAVARSEHSAEIKATNTRLDSLELGEWC